MANIEFCIPLYDGSFSYAVRNTGDAWPDLATMTGGVIHPQRTFSFPICDEVRINFNATTDQLVKLAYISGLSLDGLNFEVLAGPGLSSKLNDPQSFETIVRPKSRQLLEWSPVSTSEVEVIITGVNQRVLDIEQIIFCAESFQPARNFDGNQPARIGSIYNDLISRASGRRKINSKLRRFRFPFLTLSESEIDQLDFTITEKLNGGFCLVRLDPTNTTGKYNFLASIVLDNGESTQYSGSNEQTIVNALEAYEQ